jgi:hypothetical protein
MRVRKTVLTRLAILVFFAPILFCMAGNVLYSLRGGEPLPTDLAAILNGEVAGGRFVRLQARPDYSRALVYVRYGFWRTTYFPLQDTGDRLATPEGVRLIVRADEWTLPDDRGAPAPELTLEGRVVPFASVPFARQVSAVYQKQQGLRVAEGALALMVSDRPADYRAASVIFGLLAIVWLIIAVSLVRDWRRRRVKEAVGEQPSARTES